MSGQRNIRSSDTCSDLSPISLWCMVSQWSPRLSHPWQVPQSLTHQVVEYRINHTKGTFTLLKSTIYPGPNDLVGQQKNSTGGSNFDQIGKCLPRHCCLYWNIHPSLHVVVVVGPTATVWVHSASRLIVSLPHCVRVCASLWLQIFLACFALCLVQTTPLGIGSMTSTEETTICLVMFFATEFLPDTDNHEKPNLNKMVKKFITYQLRGTTQPSPCELNTKWQDLHFKASEVSTQVSPSN